MKNMSFGIGILIIGFFLMAQLSFSQKSHNVPFDREYFPNVDRKQMREMQNRIDGGDEYFYLGFPAAYSEAIDIYLPAHKFNPSNASLNYKLGVAYLYTHSHEKALSHLKKAFELDPEVEYDIKLLLGEAYHQNLSLDTAVMYYKQYELIAEEPNYVRRQIEACKRTEEFIANPANVFIDNLGPGTNTSWPEYSPVINADESIMFFTTSRPDTKGGMRSPDDLLFYEDIYYSVRSGSEWTEARHAEDPINTELHDATVGLSNDGTRLFIYRGDNGGDLYFSELDGYRWSEPKPLPGNINTSAQESSASFSPDERTLYFTSDRRGGYGGSDIYMAKLDNRGKWTDIQNIGPAINTEGNEMGVFMHPDGRNLYFSSTRHTTSGGFDIFYSTWDGKKWSEPVNLGYPINTPDDELFMVISADGQHGYYASTKKGGFGDSDIYQVVFLGARKPVMDDAEDIPLAGSNISLRQSDVETVTEFSVKALTLLKGQVLDAFTQEAIEAKIELTDNALGKVIAEFTTNSRTGGYLIALPSGKNYGIAVTAQGYLFHSENIDIPEQQGFQEVEKDVFMYRPELGQSVILRNIFFDFDKATLRPESRIELDRLLGVLIDFPTIKIEISGHTDNIGSSAYNKNLSMKRAKAVVDYLIENGISEDRLEYVGYGFDRPVATNSTPEGRQQNRRTEFKVIEE